MNLVLLTAGSGGYYCGSCMRDNTLARALIAGGHKALLLPLYMPLTLDEPSVADAQIFFNGMNVYLQDKLAIFRHTPRFIDRILGAPWLLKLAMRFSGLTDPSGLGSTALSMLQGEQGRQRKELEYLADWLKTQPKPDAIVLPNALLLGLARRLKAVVGVPVLCTLQGEDYFVDSLNQPWAGKVWDEMRSRAADADGFIPVSRYYGGIMQDRLGIAPERIHPVLNGIDMDGYGDVGASGVAEPVVGYLARISFEKGLVQLIDAVADLVKRGSVPGLKLRVAGSVASQDRPLVERFRLYATAKGLGENIEWVDCPDKAAKIEFLKSLKILSVPATYGESFGLFAIEALACGVPVVLPDHGALSEIVAATGGGLLTSTMSREAYIEATGADLSMVPAALKEVADPISLADGLERALTSQSEHQKWRKAGRQAVGEQFTAAHMAENFVSACRELIG